MTKDLASRMQLYKELDGKRTQGEWLQHPNGLGGSTTEIWVDNGETPEKGERITKHVLRPDNANFIAQAPAIYADAALMYGLLEECEKALKIVAENTASYSGCRCSVDDCAPGDCWPCRMMSIGTMADEALDKLKTHGLVGEGDV